MKARDGDDITEVTMDQIIQERIAKSKCMTIALMAFGEMGHLIPLCRIAKALENAGHTCHILTFKYAQDKLTNFAKTAGLKAKWHFPSEITRFEVLKGIGHGEDEKVFPAMKGAADQRVVDVFCESILKIEPDLIVGDFYSTFPSLVAD